MRYIVAILAFSAAGCATGSADDPVRNDASLEGAANDAVADIPSSEEGGGDAGDATTDAVAADSSLLDGAPSDSGSDSATVDSVATDTDPLDTGAVDTGAPDTGVVDTGAVDTGCTATSCPSGSWCSAGVCAACDTSTHCGPSCGVCSGATPSCGGALAGCQCTTGPDSCGGVTTWCSASKTCVACGAAACGNGRCDCGESSTTCPADCPSTTCPKAVSLGTFTTGADSWTFDGLFRWDSGSASMVAGSSTKYSSSYTQNLTNPSNVDLSKCASATLTYRVRLADDPGYASKGSDKSERLYVQCSGDGGSTWNNLTPTAWPVNQSPCATSYCCGGPGLDRSFPMTAQTANLPSACLMAATRFRFQAKGSSVWNLQNPGWYVDDVVAN